MQTRTKLGLGGAALALTISLSACGGYNNDRGRGDAPVGNKDDAPADVLNFPDLFANVAMKCDGHSAVISLSVIVVIVWAIIRVVVYVT
jgi:hypothetical protein